MKYMMRHMVFAIGAVALLDAKTLLSAEDAIVKGTPAIDPAGMKPFVDFYSIGALRPHASAGRIIVTDDVLEQWRAVRGELLRVAGQEGGERAADAILLLSCGEWLYEKDSDRAIELSESVVRNHPAASTILSVNPHDWVCPLRLDLNWHFHIRDELEKGSGKRKPMSRKVLQSLEERRKFVNHVHEYPPFAADVASLLTALIANGKNDYALLESSLNRVLDRRSFEEMNRSKLRDKQAASEPHGGALRGLRRPEITATMLLAMHYAARGRTAEACSLAETLADAVSDDGFYDDVNTLAGDLLRKSGAPRKAERQYRIALSGYLEGVEQTIEAEDASSIDRLPVDGWRKKIESMKRAIRDSGGDVEINAQELDSLLERKEKGGPGCVLDQDTVGETLKKMNSKKGKYADPEERKQGASDLVKMLKEREGTSTKENREDLKKARKSLALGLARMAAMDESEGVRVAMVDLMNEIIFPRAEGEDGPVCDADRTNADNLLAQIMGKNVKKPVPYPETNLADMEDSALLYTAAQVETGRWSLEEKRLVAQTLANSESPALYGFFGSLVQNTEDAELRKIAARGLGRIIKDVDIDDSGMIVMSE